MRYRPAERQQEPGDAQPHGTQLPKGWMGGQKSVTSPLQLHVGRKKASPAFEAIPPAQPHPALKDYKPELPDEHQGGPAILEQGQWMEAYSHETAFAVSLEVQPHETAFARRLDCQTIQTVFRTAMKGRSIKFPTDLHSAL